MSGIAWLFVYGLLSSYCLAGCLSEHFAIMPGWRYVGAGEFHEVHVAQGNGLGFVYVIAKIALTVLIGALLFIAPSTIPRELLWVSAGLLVVSWASSFVLQFPIQTRIRDHKTTALIDRLYRTDWIRVAAMAGHNGVVWFIIHRAIAQ
jgi:glucan phosphoethanolaminetransferase (alkaline phosphatase superfamily)